LITQKTLTVKHIFSILCLFLAAYSFAANVDYFPVPSGELVKHSYYALSYNEPNEQANWVYYVLTDSMVLKGGEERTNKFKVDKLVVTGSAKSSDYTKSGYDRGHLCPAADMDFNPVAMDESFMMSNISPQEPDFNRGIWKELETTVREWAKNKHQIFVATGPIFNDIKGKIGEDEVTVPGYFYKIIYDPEPSPEMIAFVLPNAKSNRPLTDFAVSTDELERLTGLDFFSQLPDDVENNLESSVVLAGWFTGYTKSETIAESKSVEPAAKTESNFEFYAILILILLIVILFALIKGRKRS